jgi:putative aldouronate transport system substrate-binding protein
MQKFVKVLALVLLCGLALNMTVWAADADTSKFVKINMLVLGNRPTNGQEEAVQAKWNELLKAKVNANLELKWIDWTDWYTKYNLILASGEPLDLITIATDWLDTWPNAQRGAFMALDELLPKYAPLTWKEVSPASWAECKYEGKIYFIPEDHYTQWINHGLYYRGDWAKEFGLPVPLVTWENLGKYLQGVKDKKGIVPWDANGVEKTRPMIEGWFNSHTDSIELPMVPTGAVLGVFMAKSAEEYYKVVSPVFDETFMDFAKLMKQWGDAGYWREDVLNFKGDTRAELRAGQTGMDAHHTQTFRSLRVDMDKDQPGSELQMFAFAEAENRNNLISMSISHGGTAVGAHSKNPERALMVYEVIRQDEQMYRLLNYGMEGVQYVIENGVMKRPAGYDNTRDGFWSDFWGGRVDRFELPSDTIWSGMPEIYARYDKIKKPFPYGRFVFNKTPVEAELAAISDVANQLAPGIAFGKAGDPVKAVEELRTKLKQAGFDKVTAELQKQLDEYRKLVEGK